MGSKIEVLKLMSHLLITLAIIGVYAYGVFTGHPDESLKNLLFVAGGYWFGAVGMSKVSKGGEKK